jgi:soluble lytic murein transglycosylase-like protein
MMGYYIDEDKDYAIEASDIQSIYKTNISTSKLKHLLIYIDGIAEEYDVNYNLLKAIITTESAWNVKARSSVNALGLMQIMRACATDFKTPHKEMYDPYVNITVGTMYLAKLLKRFPDVETALVAYNEGPRHAKKYKAEYIYNAKYVLKVTNHLINFESVLLADNS